MARRRRHSEAPPDPAIAKPVEEHVADGLTIGQPTALGITVARWEERLAVFMFVFALMILLTKGYGTPEKPGSWNDQARFATIQSLVEQGTWAIDNTSLGYWTGDKVFVGEHFYSTKPPLLSGIGAVLYYPMHKIAGWTYFNELQAPTIYYLITLLLMGVPLAGAAVLLYNTMQELGLGLRWRLLGIVSFALGSLYLPYSTIFQNHTIAGIAGLYSFVLILRVTRGIGPTVRNLILAGLMVGFGLACDIVGASPFAVALLVWTIARWRMGRPVAEVGWLLTGFLVPVVIHFACNIAMIGDWRPIYTNVKTYKLTSIRGFYGEVLERRGYFDTLFDPYRWRYIINSLIGIRGIFFYTPTLLFGFWITWQLVQANWSKIIDVTKDQETALRAWTAGFLGMTIIAFLYLLLRTENYGGTSYGSRYFIAPMAILLLFASLTYGPLGSVKARGWYAEALRFSVVFSVIGLAYPWGVALINGVMTNFSLAANLQGYSWYLIALLLGKHGFPIG